MGSINDEQHRRSHHVCSLEVFLYDGISHYRNQDSSEKASTPRMGNQPVLSVLAVALVSYKDDMKVGD